MTPNGLQLASVKAPVMNISGLVDGNRGQGLCLNSPTCISRVYAVRTLDSDLLGCLQMLDCGYRKLCGKF